jgi:5-methyltetrahydrofolate--homocysteine methyltransferase
LSTEKHLTALRDAVVNLDFDGAAKAAREAMAAGVDPNLAINEGLVPGMGVVGDKYEKGVYFLSELVVAAEVMKESLNVITPYVKGATAARGKVVIATVEGDMHDLGKNIVTSLLKANGFDVLDLGVNVPTARIVNAVKEFRPDVVGMSALLSLTMPKMQEVIEALKREVLRNNVKIIVGGAALTPEFAQKIGADHKAANALEGVKKCNEWVSQKERKG